MKLNDFLRIKNMSEKEQIRLQKLAMDMQDAKLMVKYNKMVYDKKYEILESRKSLGSIQPDELEKVAVNELVKEMTDKEKINNE